jgi:hypothetical protein
MDYLSVATGAILEAISTFFFMFFILCLTCKLGIVFFEVFIPHKEIAAVDDSINIFFNDKDKTFVKFDRNV